MPTIGADLQELSKEITAEYAACCPSWSPDGKQLVFSVNGEERWGKQTNKDSAIYVVNEDGTELRRVIANNVGYQFGLPAFQPKR